MRIYIAGPYTKGDVAANVRTAILKAEELYQLGHDPFIPHLTHFWHLLCPGPWAKWMHIDSVWLKQCEALYRLPGESIGADMEIAEALRMGIPVHYNIDELGRS